MTEFSAWTTRRFGGYLKAIKLFPAIHAENPKVMSEIQKWENRHQTLQNAIAGPDRELEKQANSRLSGVVKAASRINSFGCMMSLLHAMNGRCYLCGEKIEGEWNTDHIHPRSNTRKDMGKTITSGNTMPTHVACNNNKGNRVATDEEISMAREAYRLANIRFFDQDPKTFYAGLNQ